MSEKKKRIEKFRKQVRKKGDWQYKARHELEERGWLDRSYAIAIEVLAELHRTGKSQSKLAKELDFSRQYLSRVLKGKENLSLRSIDKLEKALGKKLIHAEGEEFFSKEGSPIEGKRIRIELGRQKPGSYPKQELGSIQASSRSKSLRPTPDKNYGASAEDPDHSLAA